MTDFSKETKLILKEEGLIDRIFSLDVNKIVFQHYFKFLANLFKLGYNDLGFYNEKGDYIVEKGAFEIYVGTNCLDVDKVTINII